MKNNLISAIAGWKSAALLALVAMVAAVAFSGVLTNTQTAEAATVNFAADDSDNAVTAAPGDTVNVAVASAFATVSITSTADGVGASFAAGGGQSVACSDDSGCDVDDSAPDTPGRQNVGGAVSVALNIDADSGEGHILLSVGGLGTAPVAKVITVSKAGLVGSLVIKHATPGDATIANSGTANLTVEVKNAASTPAGMNNQDVVLITSLGTIGCDGSAGSTQTCTGTTGADDAGDFVAVLTGGGVEGIATITASLGTRTESVQVTLFGSAKNLMAEPMQESVEIGGDVYIVLTVKDGAGNPVAGQMVTPLSANEVVGPDGVDNPVLVVTEKNTAGDSTPNPTVPDGRGYSKDKPAAGTATAIPACGDDNAHIGEDTASYDELFGSDDTAGTSNDSEGTNAKGQCVVYVTVPEDTTDATKSATRGEHTLNFAIGTIKASATIEVAGKPHSISTDVTDTVDPASVEKVTVSVFDDQDVLVGITDVSIRKVGGDGLVENAGTSTMNGTTSFTFIAPSTPGSAEILITAGTVNHRVTITIGEPPAEEPEGPPPTWSQELVSGTHNIAWIGEDGAPVSAGVAEGVSAIWQWNGSTWLGYFPTAVGVPGGNNLESLSHNAAYFVIVD